MITFREVKEKVKETYGDKTPGFRYGIVMFYSIFTGVLTALIEQLVQVESLDGITREDRRALILWIQQEIQRPVLVTLGFKPEEVDEDILESRIMECGHGITEQ